MTLPPSRHLDHRHDGRPDGFRQPRPSRYHSHPIGIILHQVRQAQRLADGLSRRAPKSNANGSSSWSGSSSWAMGGVCHDVWVMLAWVAGIGSRIVAAPLHRASPSARLAAPKRRLTLGIWSVFENHGSGPRAQPTIRPGRGLGSRFERFHDRPPAPDQYLTIF